MTRMIPWDKMSRKASRARAREKRNLWPMNPATRVRESAKLYDRNRVKHTPYGLRRRDSMKSKNPWEFRSELRSWERFGSTAVRFLGAEAIEQWGNDPESLADLASLFIEASRDACDLLNDDLSSTYDFLYASIQEHARQHLDRKAYHSFCEAVGYELY